MIEQFEKIGGGRLCNLLERQTAQRGEGFGDVANVGRLVLLTPPRYRGEPRRIGLQQQPIERQSRRYFAKFVGRLERHDP